MQFIFARKLGSMTGAFSISAGQFSPVPDELHLKTKPSMNTDAASPDSFFPNVLGHVRMVVVV